MKKALSAVIIFLASMFVTKNVNSQALKVGVFDIDVMVQAMPGYRAVDSLMQIFDRDTIGALRDYNESEYRRLDSTYRSDSALVAQGKKPKTILDIVTSERQKAIINVVYFQQIAQNNSNAKRASLSQGLYNQVVNAYKKVLARKKYTLVLKPNTYEGGFAIDNVFIAVARELKLTDLPENLLDTCLGTALHALPCHEPFSSGEHAHRRASARMWRWHDLSPAIAKSANGFSLNSTQ